MDNVAKVSLSVCIGISQLLGIHISSINVYGNEHQSFAEVNVNYEKLKSGRCTKELSEVNMQTGRVFNSFWISKSLANACNAVEYIRVDDCIKLDAIDSLVSQLNLEKIEARSIRCDIKNNTVFIDSDNALYADLDWELKMVKRFWTNISGVTDYSRINSSKNACLKENAIDDLHEVAQSRESSILGEYKEWEPTENRSQDTLNKVDLRR